MIVKETLNEQIYRALKHDILSQKIGFGEKLVNRELQEKFDVSSTPVRDAINHLYRDGLVKDINKGGARVIAFDLSTAIEVNEIVSLLNSSAVKLSAEKSDIHQVSVVLEQCISQQITNKDSLQYFEYDFLFHDTFFEYSHNCRLKELYLQYHSLWEILIMYYYRDKARTKSEAISQHQQIFNAYQAGDITLAQQHMEQHFSEAVSRLENALQKRELASEDANARVAKRY